MKRINFCLLLTCMSYALRAQLYISPGATLHLNGNASLTLQNQDLINDGGISTPATGKFIFNGNGNNQISGASVPAFSELEIAKTGTGLLTLGQNIQVAGKLVFTSNLIDMDNYNIELGSTGFLDGEKESSRIIATGTGEIISIAALNAPSGANPGNLGAIITSSQNLGSTIIQRGHQSQVNTHGTGSSILRYYDIAPSNNTGLNATLRIYYFDAEKNSLDENTFELYKSDDEVNWANMGHLSRDASLNYVEQGGLTSFSRWTLSNTAGAIPVTGMKLSGQWKNGAAWLEWITQTEYNNSHFNVERKYEDDLNFFIVGRKNTAHPGGNSNSKTTYYWQDHPLSNKGPLQYRIQQQSLDGTSSFSNIIAIRPDEKDQFIVSMYPTLSVKEGIYLKTGGVHVKEMHVQITDMSGRIVLKKTMDYQSGWLTLPQLSGGAYKIIVMSGEYNWNGSFVKE